MSPLEAVPATPELVIRVRARRLRDALDSLMAVANELADGNPEGVVDVAKGAAVVDWRLIGDLEAGSSRIVGLEPGPLVQCPAQPDVGPS